MDMSDFTAGTVGTGQDSAVDDDTSTDTGSQSNGYQIGIAFKIGRASCRERV